MTQRLANDRLSKDVPGRLWLTRNSYGANRICSRFRHQADRATEGLSIHVYD
jgi:hypothetical protein